MKTSKKLIVVGTAFLLFGGMGFDGTEDNIAKLIAIAGLVLMAIGLRKMKPFLLIMMCSVFLMIPKVEAHAMTDKPILYDEIIGYCDEIGDEYGICSELLQSIIQTESEGNPDAKNGNCIGIMQINQRYHKDRMERLGVTDLYDPYSNILAGADYLMEIAGEYEDIGLTLDIYHGDRKAFERYEKDVVSDYATKILERSEILEREHGK